LYTWTNHKEAQNPYYYVMLKWSNFNTLIKQNWTETKHRKREKQNNNLRFFFDGLTLLILSFYFILCFFHCFLEKGYVRIAVSSALVSFFFFFWIFLHQSSMEVDGDKSDNGNRKRKRGLLKRKLLVNEKVEVMLYDLWFLFFSSSILIKFWFLFGYGFLGCWFCFWFCDLMLLGFLRGFFFTQLLWFFYIKNFLLFLCLWSFDFLVILLLIYG